MVEENAKPIPATEYGGARGNDIGRPMTLRFFRHRHDSWAAGSAPKGSGGTNETDRYLERSQWH